MTITVVGSYLNLYGSVTEEDIRRAADRYDKVTHLACFNVDFEMVGLRNNGLANLLHRRSFEHVELWRCEGPLLLDDWGSNTKRLTMQSMPTPPRLLLGGNLLELALVSTSLSEQAASNLGEQIGSTTSRLEVLDLSETRFVGDGVRHFARGVQSNKALQRLIVTECNLIDEQVAQVIQAFHHHPSIQEVDLSFNKCRSDGMDALVQFLQTTKLSKLAMGFQAFGEAKRIDLRSLSAALATTNNTCLKYLELGGNSLRDEPDMPFLVRALCVSDTLETLDLSENRFTNKGIAMLAEHLGDMASLRYLLLNDNRFDDAGVQLLANGMASSNNHVLEDIELERQLVDTEACRHLEYHLDANWGGRGRFLLRNNVIMPLSLWPLVLERPNKPEKYAVLTRFPVAADIIYCLLRDRPWLLLH
jgi:Ran GTPase-activating protein (RanGAP) involved in mRNA processing and transport